jgi:PAS domain S-box-containing protein
MMDGSQFQEFFQNMYDGVLITDRRGRVVDVNQKSCTLCGYTKEELCSVQVGDILGGVDPATLVSVGEALEADRHVLVDTTCRRHDDSVFTCEVAVTLLHITQDGQFCFFVRDTTDRQEAERRLRDQEEELRIGEENLHASLEQLRAREQDLARERDLLQLLMDSIPDRIFFKDSECRLLRINATLADFHGLADPRDVVGKTDFDFFEADVAAGFYADDRRILSTGQPLLDKKQRVMRSDGSVQYSSVSKVPIRDAEGAIVGLVGISRDITARIRAEEQLQAVQKQLERVHRLESTSLFAGQIAHDFNNLLVPLLIYPELIKKSLNRESQEYKDLETMQATAQQIADINQDLLALSKRGNVKDHVMDLHVAVSNHLDAFRASLVNQPVELVWEPKAASATIKFDASQLARVIQNLCQNAVDAMENGGRLTLLTQNVYVDAPFGNYTVVNPGEYVRLDVSDTGSGIPDAIKDKIFDPFFSTKASGSRKGSGLGLSIVYGIVTDHSGYIDLDSRVGHGATFSLYFPICHEKMASGSHPGVKGGTERILVVDDDAVQLDVICRILSDLGYSVVQASSGEAAVRTVQQSPERFPDLIVMDLALGPGLGGVDAYREILAIHPGQKALTISGLRQVEQIEAAQKLGAGAHLSKPLKFADLALAVRQELDRQPVGRPVT